MGTLFAEVSQPLTSGQPYLTPWFNADQFSGVTIATSATVAGTFALDFSAKPPHRVVSTPKTWNYTPGVTFVPHEFQAVRPWVRGRFTPRVTSTWCSSTRDRANLRHDATARTEPR